MLLRYSSLPKILSLVGALMLWQSMLFGAGIEFTQVQIQPSKINAEQAQAIKLSYQTRIQLSKEMLQAIHRGVKIEYTLYISLISPRPYWLDDVRELKKLKYRLSFDALTRHYLLREPNGSTWNFSTLTELIRRISQGRGVGMTLPKADNLEKPRYIYIKSRLEAESLKLPVRVQSWIKSTYTLRSKPMLKVLPQS